MKALSVSAESFCISSCQALIPSKEEPQKRIKELSELSVLKSSEGVATKA